MFLYNKSVNINKDYNEYELNNLEYKEALKFDKSNNFQYYISLLKKRNVLIFTFYTKNDYNSRYIKVCTFFFHLLCILLLMHSFLMMP